ncbi:MAG: SpoIIE family protein phosphatase [Flavobacteriales bacterium]|nr:SpoIIE family protein phosphatase [Flavobacteriales bacterium]
MKLTMGVALGALPVVLLGASVVISNAYNRLHKRNQRAEQDRQSLMEVLEGSNDALFVINFVNGRIYQANERAAIMLGYSREELAHLTIFQLHPDEHLQSSALRIADAWENKGAIYEDIPLLKADGGIIEVESSVRVTSYDGKPAVILFARDIRERLALQRRVAEQQVVVGRQNRDLLSSIRYAQRIQRAVLPEAEQLQEIIPESFILFRPRDIVSGDLYWFAEVDGMLVIAAADCTGHGVPGALLSLIAAELFRESVMEERITDPARILDALRTGFVHALNRNDGGDNRDGMNVGMATLDPKRGQLQYAGAYGPMYLVRDGELIEFKGDRMPIGQHEGTPKPFGREVIDLQAGDRFYLFSDGLCDQFGGPLGKKLRSAGLKQWLIGSADLSMEDQYQAVSDRFRQWKGGEEQVDDVLLIGVQYDGPQA